MTPVNPGPQPGDPPRSNPGQIDQGTDYTRLTSGQDVRRSGYYFGMDSGRLTYYSLGDTMPGSDDTWYFVSEDPDVSLEDAARQLRSYGFQITADDLRGS